MNGPEPGPPIPAVTGRNVVGMSRAGRSLSRGVLDRVLDAMPAAFLFLDPRWRVRYVNTAAEELMGRDRTDLLGRSLWDLYPDLVGGPFEAAYREAAAAGRPVTFEAPYAGTRDGWYEVRAWPGRDGLAVYFVDVTERHRMQEAVQRAAARMALLAEVNAQLSGALDSESALGRLARLVVPTLTDGCIVTIVDREGRARDIGSWHADPARRPLMARYARVRLETLPPTSPVGAALAAGSSVTESVAAILALMPPGPARDLLLALGPESAVVLPLVADGRPVGVLTLYQDSGRVTTAEDLDTAREVAAQAARAVARVHVTSQQAKLAEELQRSLLTEPPPIEHASVVVRYVPAAEAARVGGDWYDAFRLRNGDAMLVIGDVVGHDTAAAASMGQLRGLLRGIAHHSGAGPAEVLRGLDEAIAAMHTGTLATAAAARVERGAPGDGTAARLRWANAGHPPPALVHPDGAVDLLGGPIGDLMLGVDEEADRSESLVELLPGATVVLYTDGLIECRGSTLDAGLDRLRRHLGELHGTPLERMCDELLERMLRGTPQDDVALVAITVEAEGARGRMTAAARLGHRVRPDGRKRRRA